MWNKFLLILFVGALTFSLSGQQYRRTRRTRGRDVQTTTVQQKKTEEKKSAKPAAGTPSRKSAAEKVKFDPAKPDLTQSQIDYVMNSQIRKRLLEYKISEKLPGSANDNEDAPGNGEKPEDGEKKPETGGKPEKFTFISRLDFAILMSRYKTLLSNFELIEVSRIRPEWYQRFQTELDKFAPIINEMTIALRAGSNERYADCVKKFKAHQKACLDFLKEKPPRISREQYDALVLKNSKIRLQNYLKRLKEEREAAIKRREEMLKQQTQPQKQPSKNESKP